MERLTERTGEGQAIPRMDLKNNGYEKCVERLPEDDKYILVSFGNCSMTDIARYEEDEDGGAFYPGDEDKSFVSLGLFVNAWMPLPELYRPEK